MIIGRPLCGGLRGNAGRALRRRLWKRVVKERLTALRAEGCGRLSAAGYVRFAQGATAPAALKVADCRSAVHSEHILKER